MEYIEQPALVYVETDSQGNIVKIFSSIFEAPTKKSIKIDEGYGDKYAHAQNLYLEKPLLNENGDYNYKYGEGRVYEQS